jgi:hypothetical protein
VEKHPNRFRIIHQNQNQQAPSAFTMSNLKTTGSQIISNSKKKDDYSPVTEFLFVFSHSLSSCVALLILSPSLCSTILDKHRSECEQKGQYLEAEITKKRIDQLKQK